ncbi:MAG: DUF3515 domain-containing protein [Actinobacteria bacterium]|nr:DUF3515 domain-containing protein [Actinomycetota bacterium]
MQRTRSLIATHHARRTVAGTLVALALMLSGCQSGTVALTPPTPADTAVRDACTDLADALPSRLLKLRRERTEPQSALTAAWSDSADAIITLRCGVHSADSATAEILNVNDVDWIPVARTSGTSFITFGRVAFVQVDVPLALRPEASYLVPLAPAIIAALPVTN